MESVEPHRLTYHLEFGPDGLDLRKEIQRIERSVIDRVMEMVRGNKKAAARLLHINRTTFFEKLKRIQVREETIIEEDKCRSCIYQADLYWWNCGIQTPSGEQQKQLIKTLHHVHKKALKVQLPPTSIGPVECMDRI